MAFLDSIVAYWKLDEESGTRNDSVGTSHLTDNGTVTSVAGKSNLAASFLAANQEYLSVDDNAALSMGDIDFTITGWFKLGTTGLVDIVGKYNNYGTANREYSIYHNNSGGKLTFVVSSNGTTAATVVANNFGTLSVDTWYFFAAVHDSVNNQIRLSVNAGTADVYAYSGGVLNGNSPFIIGALPAASRYATGAIDEIGVWKRALTSQEISDLYNSGNGLAYPFGETLGTISLLTPVANEITQRNASDVADIDITGTYTGTPTSIEASWNGGAYAVIEASPSGGSFSGVLSDQSPGQGTIAVRFANDTAINALALNVGIGDIFCIAGQSNADGHGANNHSYSHATLKACMKNASGAWEDMTDPTSESPGAGGSVWTLLATLFMADQSVPMGIIPCSYTGSRIAEWETVDPLYTQMAARINSIPSGIKAVLWWQGESEAADGQTYAYCVEKYGALVDNIFSDFGVPTVMAQIGDRSTTSPTSRLDNVRSAQAYLWNNNQHALPGPSLYDVTLTADGVHFTTDTEQQIAANRWWAALEANFYGGSDGRGPVVVKTEHNQERTEVTVQLSDSTLPIVGAAGFTVKSDGVAATISSAQVVGQDEVLLSLAARAAGDITVSLGEGRTGTGASVPTDSSTYNLPGEVFVDRAVKLKNPGVPMMVGM